MKAEINSAEYRNMNDIAEPMGCRSAASFLAAAIPSGEEENEHSLVVDGRLVWVR